jgi:hypothetical protein
MVGPEARLREGLFNPLSHCFMGEGWGEGAGEPAKITVSDSPSAPVRLCIWQRCANPHPNPLPGQGEGIYEVVTSQSHTPRLTPQTVFRQSHLTGEGPRRRRALNRACSWRLSTLPSIVGEGDRRGGRFSTSEQLTLGISRLPGAAIPRRRAPTAPAPPRPAPTACHTPAHCPGRASARRAKSFPEYRTAWARYRSP